MTGSNFQVIIHRTFLQENKRELRISTMDPKEKHVICTECLKPFSALPKISLAGFQKFFCPHCKKWILYPLARKAIYWIIPVIVSAIFFLSILALIDTEWADGILVWMSVLTIHIDEKKGFLLWPLFAWSLIRLGGMYYKKVLEISRKILYGIGLVALAAVIVALLGLLAGVMRLGYVYPPLIGAVLLLGFFVYGVQKDTALRKKVEQIGRS